MFKLMLTLLILCAGFTAVSAQANTAYVVLGENGKAIARLLTENAHCPLIRFDAKEVRMDVRALPASLPLRPTASKPQDSKPSVFPLLTCEKTIPAGTLRAAIGDQPLPVPAADFKRIVVIGDTGCRLKKADNAYQACNDKDLYPFAKVAAAAANWKPDLIVHVGDYHYRENACPEGDAGCAGSPWGYGWDAWNADFFTPAAALLKTTPWVMVRGNHESCKRAGQGWWRMMDPHPLIAGRDCNDAANDDRGNYSDPYTVPLGNSAQLIVMDTSNTINGVIPQEDIRQIKYRDMYKQIDKLSQQADFNMLANHHPVLGFGADQDKQGKVALFPGNLGIQSVFGALNPLIFPPKVDVLLSGHVHVWEQASFASTHPSQFIAGFAGTLEDIVPLPETLPTGATPAPGAVVEHMSSWVNGFGFMTMERQGPSQWDVKVWDTDGKIRNTCTIDGRHSVCKLAQVR